MNTLHIALTTVIAAAIGALLAGMLTVIYQRRQAARARPRLPAAPSLAGAYQQQALNARHMRTIQTQGIITAWMDVDREVTPNPYEEGTPERAVWYGGYAMAAVRVREAVL